MLLTGTALATTFAFNSYSQKTNKEVPCVSEKEVAHIISQIPGHFKKTDTDSYLIEFVPEAKKGYYFGGELTVYFPKSCDSVISIFDRTSLNPSEWYNVTNWDSKNKGCSNFGIHLNIKDVKHLSKTASQEKFNESIYKIRKIINGK